MNYELTWRGRVIQRKHGHLWGTNAATLTPYCTQTRSTNRHHAPLLRQPICNHVRKRAKRVLPPDASASLLFCHLFLSVIQSDMSACPNSFLRHGRQCCRRLPSDLARRGSSSHSSIVNHGVGWEGYSHVLTHWQLHTACWDIISENVEGVSLFWSLSSADSLSLHSSIDCL